MRINRFVRMREGHNNMVTDEFCEQLNKLTKNTNLVTNNTTLQKVPPALSTMKRCSLMHLPNAMKHEDKEHTKLRYTINQKLFYVMISRADIFADKKRCINTSSYKNGMWSSITKTEISLTTKELIKQIEKI